MVKIHRHKVVLNHNKCRFNGIKSLVKSVVYYIIGQITDIIKLSRICSCLTNNVFKSIYFN